MLEHFVLPSADQLFKGADFIFQQDLVPAHTAKSTKSWLNDHGVGVTGQQTHQTWIPWRIYGVLSRGKMRDKRPKNADELKGTVKETWASAVPQTDQLYATPNWGSSSSKRSPYQVVSTYTVNEHTFQIFFVLSYEVF